MPVNPAADVADLIEREKQRRIYSLRDNALLPYDPPDWVLAIAQGERIPVKDVEHMRSLCNQLRVTHSYIVRLQRDWDIHNGLVPVATEEIQKPVLAGDQARKPRPVYKAPVRTAADVRRSQLFEAKLQRAQAKREAEADAKHAREQKARERREQRQQQVEAKSLARQNRAEAEHAKDVARQQRLDAKRQAAVAREQAKANKRVTTEQLLSLRKEGLTYPAISRALAEQGFNITDVAIQTRIARANGTKR
ncbi:MAG: hypothetical protein WA864_13300 [Acetobacteraceae bacterium]